MPATIIEHRDTRLFAPPLFDGVILLLSGAVAAAGGKKNGSEEKEEGEQPVWLKISYMVAYEERQANIDKWNRHQTLGYV